MVRDLKYKNKQPAPEVTRAESEYIMTKKEIIKELEELYALLDMSPQKYADKMNKKLGIYVLKAEHTYPHKVGLARARILNILNEEEERETMEKLLLLKEAHNERD